MKASDLMIGDWVVYDGDTEYSNPIQIEGMDIATDSLITSDREDVGFDGIQPIPLDDNILEKNGFECRIAWMLPGEDLGIKQAGDEWNLLPYYASWDSYRFCTIEFVHELQHALKLCGIDKEIVL